MLLLVFLAGFVLGIDAGGSNFHTRFSSNLVCLYPFTDGQTTPSATTVADVSNSTFSPGSLVLGSTASWIPTSLGVRLAARAPGQTPGVGLTSTLTLSNWTLHMRAQQSIAAPTFTVELWIRSSNAVQTLARALVGFRDWSATFATPGQEIQSYGMKLEDNVKMNWYVTNVNSTGYFDAGGGSFNATLRNASSLMMVTLTYCKRVNASLHFGDCYVDDMYMHESTMAYCLTIRGGMNYTSCNTKATGGYTRFANIIDFRAWSLANMLQFAPFYSSNFSYQPHSWAGDILLAAVYAQSLNGSTQAQNYAAGLPNSNPYVASSAQMSAFEDIMNASLLFAFTGYDFDESDQLRFDVVQLPAAGTLYDYNGTHFLPITSVPYRITGAAPLAGYLQAPALTYGMNFTSFQFNAWDGQTSSRTNCTVTVNVFNVNHVPHSFPSNQTVNAQVPTGIDAFRCTDPDAPAGDYIAQYCVASAPEFGGTFTANQVPVVSFPYCFSSNSTTDQLLYTSLAISANSTNITDVFTFYCADTFGTHSNATRFFGILLLYIFPVHLFLRYYLYVQNSVWAVAGTSTGPENGNITVQLLGTSNITTNIQYHIVGLPAAGVLYNGNNTQIGTVPVAVVNASGCVRVSVALTASVVQVAFRHSVLCASASLCRPVSVCTPAYSDARQELHAAVHRVGHQRHHRHLGAHGAPAERDARKLRVHRRAPRRCVCAHEPPSPPECAQRSPATRASPLPPSSPSQVTPRRPACSLFRCGVVVVVGQVTIVARSLLTPRHSSKSR